MKVLVTGGAGYIGSHTCVELLNEGHEVVIIDNFSNSKPITIDSIRTITHKNFKVYPFDLRDEKALEMIFEENKIDAVIHFASLKAVGESVKKPLEYYSHNIDCTLILCKIMEKYKVRKLVFSSSATVYGEPKSVPIAENFPTHPTNPYGRTKLIIEDLLKDIYEANKKWSIAILRYFNPIGAHKSGLLGENPHGIPNNLLPYITKVATHEMQYVNVYGDDYNTKDGTGVRDYIHVVDLAKGHLCALRKLNEKSGIEIYNLGTGKGHSVLEMIEAFEKASGERIRYEIVERRPGDIAVCYASTEKANIELGWKANSEVEEMCIDTWHFVCRQQLDRKIQEENAQEKINA